MLLYNPAYVVVPMRSCSKKEIMQNVNYLDGFIYHMVHVDNLRSIFQRKTLLSQEMLEREGIKPRSIAEPSVQNLRDRIFIVDFYEHTWRNLHSYVPFYFSTCPPMLYVQLGNGMQNKLVIFKVPRSILKNQGAVFTDGNATNQQLSQGRNERVFIVPAGGKRRNCTRQYKPSGPLGTSPLISDFYCDIKFLETLNWKGINSQHSLDQESKRVRSAEVLIPDSLPITEIYAIAVGAIEMVDVVNTIIAECGVVGLVPQATYEPDLFR